MKPEPPHQLVWRLAMRAQQCPGIVVARQFLDDAYEFLRKLRGKTNDEVADRFGELLTAGDSDHRAYMVRVMLALSMAVASAAERRLEETAAVAADQASERFELAMLYLLEAAMAKGTIRAVDAVFAKSIARGDRSWR